MNKSESIATLAAALSAAQAEMPAVKFDATNPFLKNKYATLGAVIETAKPVLAKHGLAVSQFVSNEAGAVAVETVLLHKSGEWVSSTIAMHAGDEKGKSMAQVAGSIITYLRRYAYASILGMYADEDGDGNAPQQPAPIKSQRNAEGDAPAAMTLEQAMTFVTSENVKYGDLTNEQLEGVANNPKAPAQKKQAANLILNTRNGGK